MSSLLDKALDEIVQDKNPNGGRKPNHRRRGNFRSRSSGPRDGVSKSSRGPRDPPRGNWAHDKYDESEHSSGRGRRADATGPPARGGGTKVRVEQLHYDIGEKDLTEVFARVGNVVKLEILYDRAGRSEGIAYVTYSTESEAELAVDQFDGANAYGQPITVKLATRGGGRGGNTDRGTEGKSLFDRIAPREGGGDNGGEDADARKARRSTAELRENAHLLNIDRYIPGDRANSRDRRGPRRGGGSGPSRGNERERRGRERRAGSAGASAGGESRKSNPRPRKTVEELDAEMNSYWGNEGGNAEGSAPAAASTTTDNPPVAQPATRTSTTAANIPSTSVTNFDEEMTDL